MDDDFLGEFAVSLTEEQRLQLLALRDSYQEEIEELRGEAGAKAAARVNKLVHTYLDRAAKILGAVKYEKVFGHPVDQKPKLIDPDMM